MNNFSRYQIIESGIGPLISESRTTVYDVLEAYDEGLSLYDICRTYNLRPLQLETALEYIEKHRERLEPELAEILKKKAERERHYNAIAAEIRKKIAQEPMTPKRAAFYALLEKNRQRRAAEKSSDAAYNAWLEENRRRATRRVAAGRETTYAYYPH